MLAENRFLSPAETKGANGTSLPEKPTNKARKLMNTLKSKAEDKAAARKGVCWLRKFDFGYGFDN